MKRYRVLREMPTARVGTIIKAGREDTICDCGIEYLIQTGWLTEVKESETLAEKEAFRERVRIAIDRVFKNWWGEEYPNNKFLIELRRSIESVE